MRAFWVWVLVAMSCAPAGAQDASQCVARDPKKAGASAYTVKGSTAMEHDMVILACTKVLERDPYNSAHLLGRGDQYYFYAQRPTGNSTQLAEQTNAEDRMYADWENAIRFEIDKQSDLAKRAHARLHKARSYSIDAITGARAGPVRGDVAPSEISRQSKSNVKAQLDEALEGEDTSDAAVARIRRSREQNDNSRQASSQDLSQCAARDPKKAGASAYTVKGSTAMEHDKVIIACTKVLERAPDTVKALLARGDQYYFYDTKDNRQLALQIADFGVTAKQLAVADWQQALTVDPDNQSKLSKLARERLVKFGGFFVNPITGALTNDGAREAHAALANPGRKQWDNPLASYPEPKPSSKPQWDRPMDGATPKSKIPNDPTGLSSVEMPGPSARKSEVPSDPTEGSRILSLPDVPRAPVSGSAGDNGKVILRLPESADLIPLPAASAPATPPQAGTAVAAAAPPQPALTPPTPVSRAQSPFLVSTPALKAPLPLYTASHALVIGIDGYGDGWGKLGMAVNDAVAVAAELQRHGFDYTLKVDRDVTMPDGRAIKGERLDRAALIAAIEAFVYGPGRNPNARLVIWYAGHGHTIDRSGYLVPQGTPNPELAPPAKREDARADFQSAALTLGRFGEYMREIKARHVLAIFDSCFSGTIFKTRGLTPTGYDIDEMTPQPVRHFVASGDAAQEVSDDGKFRKLFIDALNGTKDADGLTADQNGDGLVTATELGRYIAARTAYYSKTLRQSPQHGKMYDSDYDRGEFVFRVVRPSP